MIENFADFCLWIYVLVDDLWQEIKTQVKHARQEPACSDSELIAMVLISECLGWDVETEALNHWHSHRDLFPIIPSQSRFNRRRRFLSEALNWMRQMLLNDLDVALDPYCAVDSLPLPVVQFHHAPRASRDWQIHDAQIGYVAAKRVYIYGYRLQILMTLRGVILDFALIPAAYKDTQGAEEWLYKHSGRRILADKGFTHYEMSQRLLEQSVQLLAMSRQNQSKHPLPVELKRIIPRWREICETVNSQLVQQFKIQRNHARSFYGFCARLLAKLTAHTFCVYLNRLFAQAEFLHIKKLAFPN